MTAYQLMLVGSDCMVGKSLLSPCWKVKRVHTESVCFRLFAAVKVYLFCCSSLSFVWLLSTPCLLGGISLLKHSRCWGSEHKIYCFEISTLWVCLLYAPYLPYFLLRDAVPMYEAVWRITDERNPGKKSFAEIPCARASVGSWDCSTKKPNLFEKFNPKTIKWTRTFFAFSWFTLFAAANWTTSARVTLNEWRKRLCRWLSLNKECTVFRETIHLSAQLESLLWMGRNGSGKSSLSHLIRNVFIAFIGRDRENVEKVWNFILAILWLVLV